MTKEEIINWLKAYGIDGKQTIIRNNATQFIENLMVKFSNQLEHKLLSDLNKELKEKIKNLKEVK